MGTAFRWKILCFRTVTRVFWKRLHHAGMRPHPCPRVTIAASSDSRHDRIPARLQIVWPRPQHPGRHQLPRQRGRVHFRVRAVRRRQVHPAQADRRAGARQPRLHPGQRATAGQAAGPRAICGAPSASSCRTPICCSIAARSKMSCCRWPSPVRPGTRRRARGAGQGRPVGQGRTEPDRAVRRRAAARRSPAPSSTAPPSSSPTSPPPISTMTTRNAS